MYDTILFSFIDPFSYVQCHVLVTHSAMYLGCNSLHGVYMQDRKCTAILKVEYYDE